METPPEGDRAGMNALFARLGAAQDAALAATPLRERSAQAKPRRVLPALLGVGLLSAASVTLVVVALARFQAPPAAPAVAERVVTLAAGQAEATPRELLAAGDSELPLRFSDGSLATFRPGARGRVLARDAHGAEVELLSGRLEAEIVHADRTRWVFRAGPFAVHVTGTRFDVEWSPQTRRLVVSLREGSVTVDGAVLGAGVPLRAGQRLTVALDGRGEAAVRTEAMPADQARAPAPREVPGRAEEGRPAGTARAGAARASDGVGRAGAADWMALSERGAHAEAWRVAQAAGLAQLQRRLPAPSLLALADVARYADARAEARAIYAALVARFPRHALAGDAVFSLGRLAFEAGDAASAARWFARYGQSWPDGPLAAEAIGRLLESSAAVGDTATARTAARAYLDRTPEGPYAALARRTLASAGGAAK